MNQAIISSPRGEKEPPCPSYENWEVARMMEQAGAIKIILGPRYLGKPISLGKMPVHAWIQEFLPVLFVLQ